MTEPDNAPRKGLRALRWMSFTFLSALLFFGGLYVPPIGFWGLLFCPTPLALLGLREGPAWMTAGLLVLVLSIVALTNPLWVVYFLLSEGLLCYALVLPAWRGRRTAEDPLQGAFRLSGSEALLLCVGASIFFKLLLVALFYALTGSNPLVPEAELLRATLRETYPEIWVGEGSHVLVLKDSIEEMLSIFPRLFPALLLSLAGLDSFVNYKLCEILQRKQKIPLAPLPAFKDWRFPKSLMWPMLLAFALPLLIQEFAAASALTTTALNLKILVNVFFFLQGAALIWWCLIRFKVRLLFRVLTLIMFSFPLAWLWLSVVGIVDLFFDFRSRLNRMEV